MEQSSLPIPQPYCNPSSDGFLESVHGVPSDAVEGVRADVHSLNDGRTPC
jgi:hypothetical protein